MTKLLFEKRDFNYESYDRLEIDTLRNYPIVYILYNENSRPSAYIGQTVQAVRRLKNHLSNSKRKSLTHSILIGHEKFNQSATYNIESNLINYFIADNQFKLQNLSQTNTKVMHNYYEKSYYNDQLFRDLWDKLIEEQIVTDTIENLQNKDIYKLSPYKELSPDQLHIKNQILDYCKQKIKITGNHVITVEGDAGTGKSVLLSSLFNTIQDLTNDEAHLLLTKEDKYNNFHHQNQLDEIIKRSKITIVIFDPKQVLKIISYWNENLLETITKNYSSESLQLTDQMRMHAKPETVKWIDRFVAKEVLPLPRDSKYELKIFEDPCKFKDAILKKNNEVGLSRIVSTFDYLHKKDNHTYTVDEEGINMAWNNTTSSVAWAENKNSVREVGSIYTVQGFDLNYVGVVLGPSVSYDEEKQQLIIDPSKYKDKGAFTSRSDFEQEKIEQTKEEIILNSINVLMKRGIHDLYIYATNPNLRKKLLSLKGEYTNE